MEKEISLEELGQIMREQREAARIEGKKVSRETIGNAIGVAGKTVYKWETGAQHPGFLNVVKFCDFLGISLDDMLGVKKNGFCIS